MRLRIGPGSRATAGPGDRQTHTDQPAIAGKERPADDRLGGGLGIVLCLHRGSECRQIVDRHPGIGEPRRRDDEPRAGRYPQARVHHHVARTGGVRHRTFLRLHPAVGVEIRPGEQRLAFDDRFDRRVFKRRPVPHAGKRAHDSRGPQVGLLFVWLLVFLAIEIDRHEPRPRLHARRRERVDEIPPTADHDRCLRHAAGQGQPVPRVDIHELRLPLLPVELKLHAVVEKHCLIRGIQEPATAVPWRAIEGLQELAIERPHAQPFRPFIGLGHPEHGLASWSP